MKLQKEWILKCKRADNWNPSSSFICSAHFKNDEFIRDLQAELLGYTPKGRRLKPEAIPSLNLPRHCIQGDQVSTSTSNRSKRMEAKSFKQVVYQYYIIKLYFFKLCYIFVIQGVLPGTDVFNNF